MTLSDDEMRVTGASHNLVARELDAGLVFAEVRRKYASAVDEIFVRLGSGGSFDASHDRSVLHGLIDLAPPGLDELAATIEIAEAVSGNDARWDLAIVDTAPTGHALRLLELPSLMHDWTKALMSILLKYQPVTGLGTLGALLLKLSRGLGTLRQLLADPAHTHFVVVTRAAALPRAESTRLVGRLDAISVHVPYVVVNAVGRGTCGPCRKAATAEKLEIAALRRAIAPARGSRALVLAATQIPPPRGARALRDWRRKWEMANGTWDMGKGAKG
jgi:arsenite-transporting ATPase